MFDIGFWEIAVIGVITLLVVGPERMPALARTAGKWLGRFSRFVGSVKADIDRELKAEEMKSALARHTQQSELHEIIEETRDDLNQIRGTTQEAVVSATTVPEPASTAPEPPAPTTTTADTPRSHPS